MKPLETWSIITGIASILSLLLSIISFYIPVTILTYSTTGDQVSTEIILTPLFLILFVIFLAITLILLTAKKYK